MEFHVVCWNSDFVHERVHSANQSPIGFGFDYRSIEQKLSSVLKQFSRRPIVHVNSAHILSPTCIENTAAIVQINDTEVSQWKFSLKALTTFGVRRCLAIAWRFYRESNAVKRASKVICNSKSTEDVVREIYRIDNTSVIYKAVDLTEFWKIAQHRNLPTSEKISLMFVGSHWAIKGLAVLLEALKKLELMMPGKYQLKICGGDTAKNRSWLSSRLKTLGLESAVQYRGNVSRESLPQELADSDLFVLPSISEALGLAAIESLATGMPVVTTNVGGLPEVVRFEYCGCMVEPNNATSLADGILKATHQRFVESEIECRANSVQMFHIEALRSKLVELYQQRQR